MHRTCGQQYGCAHADSGGANSALARRAESKLSDTNDNKGCCQRIDAHEASRQAAGCKRHTIPMGGLDRLVDDHIGDRLLQQSNRLKQFLASVMDHRQERASAAASTWPNPRPLPSQRRGWAPRRRLHLSTDPIPIDSPPPLSVATTMTSEHFHRYW